MSLEVTITPPEEIQVEIGSPTVVVVNVSERGQIGATGPSGASSSGDMVQAVYDTDNDGVVNNSKLFDGLETGEFLLTGEAANLYYPDSSGDNNAAQIVLLAAETGNYSQTGHNHTESDITDLDKYSQSQIDDFLTGKLSVTGQASDSNLLDGYDSSYFYPNSNPSGFITSATDSQTLSYDAGDLTISNGNTVSLDDVVFTTGDQAISGEKTFNERLTAETLLLNTGHSLNGEQVGETFWDVDNGTMSTKLTSDVVLQHGQEELMYVKNQTGSTITNGTPVWFAGTLGASGRILIQEGVADGSSPSEYFIGVATEDIPDGSDGYVTVRGIVRGIQTNGANYGETWNDGDIIYVSPTVTGALTNVAPEAPNNFITVAAVVNAHSNNGHLEVRPTWSPKLQDLQDVDGPALTTDGQFPVWNQTGQYFGFDTNIGDYYSATEVDVLIAGVIATGDNQTLSYGSGQLSIEDGNTVSLDDVVFTTGDQSIEGQKTFKYLGVYDSSIPRDILEFYDGAAEFAYDKGGSYFTFTADSAPKVGINTLTPAYNLDVNGDARFTSLVQTDTVVANSNDTTVNVGGGILVDNYFANSVDWENRELLDFGGSTSLNWYNGYVELSNYLGIGVSPSYPLDVLGDTQLDGIVYTRNQLVSLDTQLDLNSTVYVDGGSNRVGIGTDSPAAKLDVAGTAKVDELTVYDPSLDDPNGNYQRLSATVDANGDATIATEAGGTGTAGDLVLAAGGGNTSLQVMDNPTTAVEVIGGGLEIPPYKQLSFGSTTYSITRTSSSMYHKSWALPFVWLSSAGELMRLDNASGNLGIGTDSPAAKLDVDGTVKSTVYTVATLPLAATTAGQRSFVSDATATHAAGIGTTVTGGGANFVPVYSDGTNWIIG